MNEVQMLTAIYRHIKEHGCAAPSTKEFGGCWSADTYRLDEQYAQLADDGYTRIVGLASGGSASSTMDRPVEFHQGFTNTQLIEMYCSIVKSTPVISEATGFYLWL